MLIYKFGGASVKNKDSFLLLKNIVSACNDDLIVVVSAMGKTTNRLEEIVKLAFRNDNSYSEKLDLLNEYHQLLIKEILKDDSGELEQIVELLFEEIAATIDRHKGDDFNFFYDQVVSFGEIISTRIVSHFLHRAGIDNQWADIRQGLITNDNYRDASIDIELTKLKLAQKFSFQHINCYITQGFIGSDKNGHTTSLGREGSDYTAAILGSALGADEVILWKDVAGIFNADPAVFPDAVLLDQIGYQEMIELAFYGAKVIHPKTIKPLREKAIPLFVKSFFHADQVGTQVGNFGKPKELIPEIILKSDQVLISISLPDLSFITEKQLSKLFALLNRFRLKANVIQHSAISFSVCVDTPRGREVKDLIDILRNEFKVLYNDGLTLYTIRHYTEESIEKLISGKKVFVEQRSRTTVQFLTA